MPPTPSRMLTLQATAYLEFMNLYFPLEFSAEKK
jgi:hypothetical protein